MEINGKPPLVDLSTRGLELQAEQRQRFHRADPVQSAYGADRVELSVRSREIQHIEELIRSTPDVREALVEQVRRSLDSGTYNVRAEQVADKILGGNLIDRIF